MSAAQRLTAVYHVRSDAASIERRANAIAIEQSVEMPLAAIRDEAVSTDIVGRVAGIEDRGGGVFAVRIELAADTVGDDAGQLVNMLFGNTSLQDDTVLHDAVLPPALAASFGGPRHGLTGLRRRCGAGARALSCSAIKPQGLPADRLAALAGRLARGRLDFVKDDHGLADQSYSPFAARAAACAAEVRKAAAETGHPTRYVPSLSGNLETARRQIAVAGDHGIDTVMAAPMVMGVSTFQALVREHPDVVFFAHPSLGGAARISPQFLIGTLFPLLGADAVIFPHHGGRFGYSPLTCRHLAEAALARTAVPVPAGGMTLERLPEILDFYGRDVMLLIGGALLSAPDEELVAQTQAFAAAVARHHRD